MAEESKHENWGGKRPGQGRPKGSANKKPLSERKSSNLNITLTAEQLAQIRAAAKADSKSISAYVLSKVFAPA